MANTLMIILGVIIGYAFVGKYVSNIVSEALSGIQGALPSASLARDYYIIRD